ncbi:MAG: hypothetical protein A2836_03315 [Candidatus Taylorbacteria bacterium RIFCSPHIGHO2_01_FULL_45_63]|uniref:Uncharacterized protein n=1 Tax=Candidatus Taylorbacteria bacterium RIFCSPHIGHO2_02_FULL_45_35 TaxID=1802311 RepID=A0A1G2MRS7_9BACT|nr:MAG: hypothetical protein A2836_03315 [Candidatus Taylorbacteria bacterium RIFCSPHIGHO2_01_FULL_45_63]OHA25919.1 MAG: hypothetical protein A3D56_02435 [Candidatus Taylorbacteria bacterium RIFCSPHIGHO2_02_FULL_45_35]
MTKQRQSAKFTNGEPRNKRKETMKKIEIRWLEKKLSAKHSVIRIHLKTMSPSHHLTGVFEGMRGGRELRLLLPNKVRRFIKLTEINTVHIMDPVVLSRIVVGMYKLIGGPHFVINEMSVRVHPQHRTES